MTNVHDERHRFLSLSGAIFNQDYMREIFSPQVDNLKRTLFRGDPDTRIIFHRKDILQRKGPFSILNEKAICEQFDKQLKILIRNSDYKVITAVIDKKALLTKRHWTNRHPYHWLMEVLIEKYTQFLIRHNAVGDLMPERRHGKNDQLLQKACTVVFSDGTRFVSKERIQKRITSPVLKFRAKCDHINGLELCDLIAHPSYLQVRKFQGHDIELGPFATDVVNALNELRYDRAHTGETKGYGWKYFS